MEKKCICLLLLLCLGSLQSFLTGCILSDTGEDRFYPVSRSNTYLAGEAAQRIYHVGTTGNVDLTYTLNLGTNEKNVYFVFTYTGRGMATGLPVITTLSSLPATAPAPNPHRKSAPSTTAATAWPRLIPFIPEVARYNRQLPAEHVAQKKRFPPPRTPGLDSSPLLFDTLGAATSFKAYSPIQADNIVLVPATCRKVVADEAEGRSLAIWVADDCTTLITAEMVDVMADKFLQPGAANDIYGWVTGIYGKEWGPHSFPHDLIDPLTMRITILIYHIDGDPMPGNFLGLFWAKDNWQTASQPESNERLMFYLDAANYAYSGEDGIWQVNDTYPDAIISTLAHEFQHMIHYYQRNVLRNRSSSVWLNELCSLTTEDLVSFFTHTRGPRGIIGTDNSPGPPENTYGRLGEYQYNNYSLTSWLGSTTNYAVAYGFGAYLARNFGHALLFRNIVQSNANDSHGIEDALAKTGYPSETFTSVLQKWGAANLLSDLTSLPAVYDTYYYNRGASWWDYNLDAGAASITYRLGSINLNNYLYSMFNGPLYYTADSFPVSGRQPAASNLYYHAGDRLTGTLQWQIRLERNTYLTVILR